MSGSESIDASGPIPSAEEIANLYVTPGVPFAFASPGSVFRHYGGRVPLKVIEKALRTVNVYSEHKEYKRPRVFNPFYVYRRRTRFQADLIEMIPLKRANRGYAYLMLIIDTFTRKVWVVPLKKKSGAEVETALRAWLETLEREAPPGWNRERFPRHLFTDRGKEFINARVQNLLRSHNVRLDTSKRGLNKAAIAERANKTLQVKIYKALRHTGRNNFIDTLPEIVESYNSSKHRSLEFASPNYADREDKEEEICAVQSRRYGQRWAKMVRRRERDNFRLGELVHVKIAGGKKLGRESRAYTPYFDGDELFSVVSVRKRMPVPMYQVFSLKTGRRAEGSFYGSELSRILPRQFKVEKYVRSRRNLDGSLERLVRLVGLHPVFDSWVPASSIDANKRVPARLLHTAPSRSSLRRLLASSEDQDE